MEHVALPSPRIYALLFAHFVHVRNQWFWLNGWKLYAWKSLCRTLETNTLSYLAASRSMLCYFSSQGHRLSEVSDIVSLRLRAAVFVNLVAMRRALSCPTNSFLSLTLANLSVLQRANYLFHSAHNSYSADVFFFVRLFQVCWIFCLLDLLGVIAISMLGVLRPCAGGIGSRASFVEDTPKVS